MEREESASADPSVAVLLDICDMLAEFHRELQRLRARRRQGNETQSETTENRDISMGNATMGADNGENGAGASPQ
jgi:hypothetical protein